MSHGRSAEFIRAAPCTAVWPGNASLSLKYAVRFQAALVVLLTLLAVSPALAQPRIVQPSDFPPRVEAARHASVPDTAPAAATVVRRRSFDALDAGIALEVGGVRQRAGWRAPLIGAGVGAAVGLGAFLVLSDGCWREIESMCELEIPVYVVGGAAVGGLFGYIFGR